MQHRHLVAETRGETLHRLRRKRDFRHHHDGALSQSEDVRDRLQINLGLAAAGDAVKQQRFLGRGENAIQRALLLRIERQRFRRQNPFVHEGRTELLPGGDLEEPFLPHQLERGGRGVQFGAELVHPAASQPDDLVVNPLLPGGYLDLSGRQGRSDEKQFFGPGPRFQHGRRHRCLEHAFDGGGDVGGEPARKFQQRRAEKRHLVQYPVDRLEFAGKVAGRLVAGQLQHEPLRRPAPERNRKKLADGQLLFHITRNRISE